MLLKIIFHFFSQNDVLWQTTPNLVKITQTIFDITNKNRKKINHSRQIFIKFL